MLTILKHIQKASYITTYIKSPRFQIGQMVNTETNCNALSKCVLISKEQLMVILGK